MFQDYNESVIESLRKSLEMRFCPEVMSRISFFYGSWEDFILKIPRNSFGFILGSEILYNEQNYHIIISILKKCLKSNGRAFIATKNMYFGLTGSLYTFSKTLQKEPDLSFRIVDTAKASIPRSIIEIYRVIRE
jgi:hypothetical protein